MKARVTTCIAGSRNWTPGDIAEGTDALTLCAAGYAVPIVEKRETAVKRVSTETRKND